jgi:sigma-B regulation protein RsbQ
MIKNVLTALNVNVKGTGTQPMIFAHGLGCDQNVWRYVSPAFENDYKVILFDYIGSGQSDKSSYNKEKYSSLSGYADDLLAICDALSLTNVILVAHSVSSMIGVLAAVKNPTVFSKLIMIGPSPSYINQPPYYGGFAKEDIEQLLQLMKERYLQWANFFAPKAVGNLNRPELAEEVESSFCKADPDITYQFAEVTFLADNRSDIKKLRTPALIMQPAEDIVAPKEVGEYLHQNIPGSTLYYMKATGHFPHLGASDETVNLIKKFLSEKAIEKEPSVTNSQI